MMSARDATTEMAPDAPSGLQASTITSTRVDLAWVDNADNEDAYHVQMDTSPSFPSPQQFNRPADSEGFSVTNLPEGTTFYFRVFASNTHGNGGFSDVAEATTFSGGGGGDDDEDDPAPPDGAPSGNALVTVSASELSQSWTDNSTNEDFFQVQLAEDSGFTTGVQTDTVTGTSKSWTGLEEGKTYYSRVQAVNGDGDSNWSGTASATTSLADPTNLTKTSQTSYVTLAWNDNSGSEQNYRLWLDGSVAHIMDANTTSIDVTNTGTYKVQAVHSSIPDSGFSNTVTVGDGDVVDDPDTEPFPRPD